MKLTTQAFAQALTRMFRAADRIERGTSQEIAGYIIRGLVPPEDMHGDRRYLAADPEGHHWWFLTPIGSRS